ncbi:MAG: AMP-binding protein, partial [Anaerohalosphaera sp.]|nr:AMP-binding protein [Anaerohalosphaera sp.]
GLGLINKPGINDPVINGSVIAAVALIFIIGVSGGLFIIPMHSFVQFKSPHATRGQVLAASNWIGWFGVLIASIMVPVLVKYFSMSAANLFIVLSVLMLALCIITVKMLPDFFVRFVALIVTKICYRIKVHGANNVPIEGPALLVSNHVSWIDALLIGVTQQRRIRFLMYRDMAEKTRFKWFFRLMGVIPISSEDPPKKIIEALRAARQAMDDGYLVGIFAEGSITRNGLLRQFRPGFERIVKGTDYPVIPVYIGGAWGSIFSYYHGSLLAGMPTKFPYPVAIHFGNAMPADSTVSEIRLRIQQLSSEYYQYKRKPSDTLPGSFIKTARRYWSRDCITDVTGKKLNYGRTLMAAMVLAEHIDKIAPDQEMIGICIPPSVGGVLANIAVALSGRTSVNLNYVASPSARQYALDQCEIKHIITARVILEKVEGLADLNGLIFLDDLPKDMPVTRKLSLFLKARAAPLNSFSGLKNVTADSTATIIFSSGSTGTPKGIMLSQHNILSNAESIRSIIQIESDDDLCVVLPFFHSFGFTCGLWLPIITGVSSNYIPQPIDGLAVADAVRNNHSTILFAPPTFLLAYLRRAKPQDFASLRLVAVGAEKLKKRLTESYQDRFGITLYEGYGATELSPVVALNVPDVNRGDLEQTGNKPGSVGHPIPGVAVKIVDPDTGNTLETGQPGLITVMGPNVMKGYYKMPEKTAEVLKDGWYNTGDIGHLDEDGFLTITDRLSRFSKIGGEMIPHIGVEEVYLSAIGSNEQIVAVIGIPEPKKGEELVVLYLPAAGNADKLHEIMTQSDVPNMWKPRKTSYVQIDKMPLLGSGKLDLASIRQIALNTKEPNDS